DRAAGVVGAVFAAPSWAPDWLDGRPAAVFHRLPLRYRHIVRRIQRARGADGHQVGPALGDPGVAAALVTHRLAQPEMRALMADEPAVLGFALDRGLDIADALEGHDDQARQHRPAHALHLGGRAAPAGHDGGPVGLARAQPARIVIRHARREV